ncbi:MAG: CoA pyrophosphatase [Mycobacteriales bacterium]|nr:CoA pyrophosphatase [Frankia sp.]
MQLPDWLRPLATAAQQLRAEDLSRFLPPADGGRASAVLVLFGEGSDGPDLLFIERAASLREHAGQPAFPGGAVDESDADAVAAALREATEEVGLDPAGVDVFAALPGLWLPPSGFVVIPVLAWWRSPSAVGAVDVGEVAAVERVPLAELADPRNRRRVRHPSGWIGPAFEVRGLFIWGFTAGVVDKLLHFGGWEVPWAADEVADLPARALPLSDPLDVR